MLSGIKTGKKRKARGPPGPVCGGGGAPAPSGTAGAPAAAPVPGNRSAADALRASLGLGHSTSSRPDSSEDAATGSTLNGLEGRGRIRSALAGGPEDDTVVVRSAAPNAKDVHEYERSHGVRFNSRGRLSRHAHDELRQRTEREMTVEEMARAERTGDAGDMDETYARNVVKMGNKRFKHYSKDAGGGDAGADEEDYLQDTDNIYKNLYRSNEDKLSPAEIAARSQSRQIAQHDAMARFTGKSWWWTKSPRFDRRYLVALGDHVSLVLMPTHRCLQQSSKSKWTGGQCLLVPNEYSESFVGLDEDAWAEVRRFQDSLRKMFKSEGRGVLFLETVTRASRSGGQSGYQCKMDVVPVPRSVERDAELYFKSALAEVAQEWGTHQRPIPLGGRGGKTLRNAVPRGFPYFYCGWDGGGVVQLIEGGDDGRDDCEEDGGAGGGGGGMRAGGGSRGFQMDFGVDTIGGMMDCDPVRFNRNRPAADGDRKAILEVCERWKKFDWTLELD